jgi:hypothetical protein
MKSRNSFVCIIFFAACMCLVFFTNSRAEVNVYDANRQFLGILLDINPGMFDIFSPSLSKSIPLNIATAPGVIAQHALLFESSDCTGPSYAGVYDQYSVFELEGKYYTGDDSVPPTSKLIKSVRNVSGGGPGCYPSSGSQYVVPAKQVTLPFNAPVAMPLRLEYQPQVIHAVSTIGTVGLLLVSILFSISAIAKIRRRDSISTFEAIKQMLLHRETWGH